MATAMDLIKRSMRLATILDAGSAPEAGDAQDALATLNALLAELHEAEVGIPDYSLASLTTALASDGADREGLAYMLAKRIAPEYEKELSRLTMEQANQAESRLRLRYFQPGTTSYAELPSAQPGSYNINTDA